MTNEQHTLRLLSIERRLNGDLRAENDRLRDEISRLSARYTAVYMAVKRIFERSI